MRDLMLILVMVLGIAAYMIWEESRYYAERDPHRQRGVVMTCPTVDGPCEYRELP